MKAMYDAALDAALNQCDARAGCLLIIDGTHGQGVSFSGPAGMAAHLPMMLRKIAENIELQDAGA